MSRLSNEEIFKKNIAVHYQNVYRFVRSLTGNGTVAEDITQSIMERAWRNVHRLKNRKRARSWLFHAAKVETERYLEVSRTDVSFEEVECELDPELLAKEEEDILKILLEREQSEQVIAALNLLSPRYQQVVKLWAMGSLKQREIAKVMDMNYHTVRICLRRGLKAFGKAYISLNEIKEDEDKDENKEKK